MNLTDNEKARFVEHIYSITNPIKPHEAAIVSSILGFKMGQHLWRFRKNHFCGGCGRELSALDYFFSAIQSHSVEFLRQQILGNLTVEEANHIELQIETSLHCTNIQTAHHALDIGCLVCGFENYGIDVQDHSALQNYVRYFYVHPGPGGGGNPPKCQGIAQTVRVGAASYEAILQKLSISGRQ